MSRLFIAVGVPDGVKTLLARHQDDLKEKLPADLVRWTDPATTHLTLVFLGEVPTLNLGVVRQGWTLPAAGPNP